MHHADPAFVHSTMKIPQFPQELIDEILSYVERTNLPNCCLVASKFRYTAQKLLFARIQTNLALLGEYSAFFSANPHLASFTRELHVLPVPDDMKSFNATLSALTTNLLPVLTSMVRLNTLRLVCCAYGSVVFLPTAFIDEWCLLNGTRSLTQLEISNWNFSSPADLWRLLRSFRGLDDLTLRSFSFRDQLTTPIPDVPLADRLQLRVLKFHPTLFGGEVLLTMLDPLYLEELSINWSGRVLLPLAENIRHLCIFYNVAAVPSDVDLSLCRHLRTVDLRLYTFNTPAITQILRRPPPSLRELRIEILLPVLEETLPAIFEALDDLFGSAAYAYADSGCRPLLERVHIIIRSWSDVGAEVLYYKAGLRKRAGGNLSSKRAAAVLDGILEVSWSDPGIVYPMV